MRVVYGREFVYTYYMSDPVSSRLRLHLGQSKPCCSGMRLLLKWGLVDERCFFEGHGGTLRFRIHRNSSNELVDFVDTASCPSCGRAFSFLFSGDSFFVNQRPKRSLPDGKPDYARYRAIGLVDGKRFLREVEKRLPVESTSWVGSKRELHLLDASLAREMKSIETAMMREPSLSKSRFP